MQMRLPKAFLHSSLKKQRLKQGGLCCTGSTNLCWQEKLLLLKLHWQQRVTEAKLEAQNRGYTVSLLYFWLNSVDLAKERVKIRVQEGGHNIPVDVIARRYNNGIKNLFDIYLHLVDECMIFDNSDGMPELLAEKNKEAELDIINNIKFEVIKSIYEKA